MPISVAELIAKQDDLFGIISRALTNLGKMEKAKRTPAHVKARMEALSSNWKKFTTNHEMLCTLGDEDKKALPYFTSTCYDQCEELYINHSAEMYNIWDEMRVKDTSADAPPVVQVTTAPPTNFRQLPRLSLPRFSGSYIDWTPFRDLFDSMVIKDKTVSNVEKMEYLKISLSGEAAQLVKNMPVTGDNFARAWETLTARYENKRAIVDTYLAALFSIRQINQESSSELKSLLGDVKESIGALEGLGCQTDSWGPILVFMIARKLNTEALKDWENSIGSGSNLVLFEELESFLLSRIRALEAVERLAPQKKPPNSRATPTTNSKQQSSAKSHQASTLTSLESAPSKNTTRNSSLTCSLCNGPHYIASCPEYRSKTSDQCREIVIQKNLCFNCLGSHQFRNCRSQKRCQTCGQPHHTSIHRSTDVNDRATAAPAPRQAINTTASNAQPTKNQTSSPSTSHSENSQVSASHVSLSSTIRNTPVLLATALVNLVSCYGEKIEARALLDQGSEVSFITESLAQRLKLPRRGISLPIHGIGGQRSSVARGCLALDLYSKTNDSFSLPVTAYILSKLTSYLPPFRVVNTDWPHINGLSLADPDFVSSKNMDLVLGAEVYSRVIEQGIRKGPLNTPVAQQTALGWILSGSISSEIETGQRSRAAHGFQCSIDHELNDLLQRFWIQEEALTSSETSLTEDEAQCEENFVNSHSRASDGRYIVRLPLKRLIENLGDSYNSAVRMLSRQEKRFSSDASLKLAYSQFLGEYESLGHMTRVPDEQEQPRRIFYLPHHAVVRESSTTTKVRVVFNGSFRTNFGITLNEILHVGPKLQTDLSDVLTRWRRYAFAFAADIEKMYRQIRVHRDDWDLQRIVWRENSEEPPHSYQLTTVTYGLTSAPYLAIRTLQQLTSDENQSFPRAVDVIQHETYVDDVLSGADDPDDARDKIQEVNACLKAGCFELQKWTSNYNDILTDIPQHRKSRSSSVSIEDTLSRALGISWKPRSDNFTFLAQHEEKTIRATKRSVLSRTAQLFDPLGWIAPVIIRAEILMQELWAAGLDWDEPLPEEFALRWKQYTDDLQNVSLISIPRWLGIRSSSLAVELHGFSDASQAALGAVIYLRIMNDLDDIRVTLVSAKTRVAPIKRVTIPRLELSAALLLVRQIARVQRVLELRDAPVHLWTDSTVTLAYINGDSNRWAEYVRNRVNEINKLTTSRWHHVSGKENPADHASRGLSPQKLAEESLWWNGPTWLSRHSTAWPSTSPPLDNEVKLEIRGRTATIATPQPSWNLVDRYSNLKTLLRVTVWCIRAFQNFKRDPNALSKESPLNPAELEQARIFWIKSMQADYFESEISLLKNSKQISKSSALSKLAPFIDASGLLRVGGRLSNALLDYDEKHPLILPRESTLTSLLIDEAHRKTLHGGTQVTLATLRRRYWIVGGRVPVRSFIHRCITCVRQRAVMSQQLMGQLPTSRVNQARPFLHAGVDYAGPIFLRTFRGGGAKTYKGYIVVFVCFSTSAMHLEIVTDYSSDAFIAAYKRFTGRRGICATMTSDCGTTLVGADRELRELFDSSSRELSTIANALANDGTRWKFNPPSAPHFGGKWEAGVKSVKFHLKRVIGETSLTYEEFSTLLIQIESVLNSRPLCPLSDDPSDLAALTPGHFIIGSSLNTIPEPSLIDVPSNRLSRWQLLRQMLEQFWKRWSTEYLQKLQTMSKWQQEKKSIKIGDLVLVKDERYPPSKWAMGRIIDVHPGQDDLVRAATVRTEHSTFKRPVVKLCLLPVAAEKDQSIA